MALTVRLLHDTGVSLTDNITTDPTLTGSGLRPRSVTEKGAIAAALKQKVWPLLDAGKVKPMIHKTFPLTEAGEAHRRVKDGHVGSRWGRSNGRVSRISCTTHHFHGPPPIAAAGRGSSAGGERIA